MFLNVSTVKTSPSPAGCLSILSDRAPAAPLTNRVAQHRPSGQRIVCTKLFAFNRCQPNRYRIMSRNILHWSYRDFRNFPDDLLEHRDSVEEIYLKENFIPTLPKWLFDFTNLRFIHLGGNLLEFIPDEICLLESLEFLDVSKNRIRELPQTFRRMQRLKRFNVCDNQITELPAGRWGWEGEEIGFNRTLLRRPQTSARLRCSRRWTSARTTWIDCPPSWPAASI